MKGGADGALLVTKTAVPPNDIAAAKKKSGGSAVLKGFCFYEDGSYIFEISKVPPAPMARVIKTIAKRDAGMTINVDCRMSSDPELAAAEANGAATAKPDAANPTGAAKPSFSAADFNRSRASWDAAKKKIHGDMEKLNSTIRVELPGRSGVGRRIGRIHRRNVDGAGQKSRIGARRRRAKPALIRREKRRRTVRWPSSIAIKKRSRSIRASSKSRRIRSCRSTS